MIIIVIEDNYEDLSNDNKGRHLYVIQDVPLFRYGGPSPRYHSFYSYRKQTERCLPWVQP